MKRKELYVSPEILKIEINDADVVTESGVETPGITLPWPTVSGRTPGSEG